MGVNILHFECQQQNGNGRQNELNKLECRLEYNMLEQVRIQLKYVRIRQNGMGVRMQIRSNNCYNNNWYEEK